MDPLSCQAKSLALSENELQQYLYPPWISNVKHNSTCQTSLIFNFTFKPQPKKGLSLQLLLQLSKLLHSIPQAQWGMTHLTNYIFLSGLVEKMLELI